MTAVRDRLRADCGSCVGLCCVAPGFTRSADFPVSKAPGVPCPHLAESFACTVHDDLRPRGYHGCVVFDCLGAGQQTTQVTYAGADWRTSPAVAREMFDVFGVQHALHTYLHHLDEARGTLADSAGLAGAADLDLRADLDEACTMTLALTHATPGGLLGADPPAHLHRMDALLTRASAHLRRTPAPPGTELLHPTGPLGTSDSPGTSGPSEAGPRRASPPPPRSSPPRRGRGGRRNSPSTAGTGRDRPLAMQLIGARLAGADLRAAELTGRLLLGADLTDADLRGADLRGADLRGANLTGADLRGALFVLQPQLTAARGDTTTRLPAALHRPAHW